VESGRYGPVAWAGVMDSERAMASTSFASFLMAYPPFRVTESSMVVTAVGGLSGGCLFCSAQYSLKRYFYYVEADEGNCEHDQEDW